MPGGTLNYTIVYYNNGSVDAHNVVLKERYSQSIAFVSAYPVPDEGTTDKWSLGELPAGSSGTILIQATVSPLAPAGSMISNRVDLTCKEGYSAKSIVNTTVAGQPLNITKSASPDPVLAGGTLTYTITYRNVGSTVQTDVKICDWLDSHIDYLIDTTLDPPLINESSGDNYRWNRSYLGPGESGTITMKVKIKPREDFTESATKLINTYKIYSNESTGMQGTLETLAIKVNSLWIYKTADKKSYSQGQNITYTINYGNSEENLAATNVTVTDYLPEGVILISPPDDLYRKTLTWDIGTLEPKESGSIMVMVQIPNKPNATFQETSVVSGEGYAYIRKELSTAEKSRSLINRAEIVGYYYDLRYPANASSTVALVGSPGTSIKTREQGSGTFRETEKSSLFQENRSVSLDKDLFASYHATTFLLPGNRSIEHVCV
jgi:uncharacterized repeat protein (TIGR01451 family)